MDTAGYDAAGGRPATAVSEAITIPDAPPSAPPSPKTAASPPSLDEHGRYRAWGAISYTIVGTYVFLFVIVLIVLTPGSSTIAWWGPWVISAILLLALVRYLSTQYWIDEHSLHAWRIFGGVRVRLDRIRRIEYASLRDLAPTGGIFGSWGWRGRMWSPVIGRFDAIYTDAARGLLVTADDYPVYLSPRHMDRFARELSRRVRSYNGRLAVDVGDPLSQAAASLT